VHHVANVYPLGIELAQVLASGTPFTVATIDAINKMNADHANEFAGVNKKDAIALLRKNSKTAAALIRSFTDADLDSSATVSLNANASLTAQFFIQNHALRHSFHHFANIKQPINK